MKTIFLIGYMGCGKSTLGKALARHLGTKFIDLDEYIEHRCKLSVRAIFASMGEERFRAIESDALNEVSAIDGAIIATGGGTACNPGNIELMNASGVTIWLTTSVQRIASRLVLPEQKAKRPAIATLSNDQIAGYVERQLALREPHYSRAQLTFDSTHLESKEEIEETARKLADVIQSL